MSQDVQYFYLFIFIYLFIKPPNIVCRRTYNLPVFLLSSFFLSFFFKCVDNYNVGYDSDDVNTCVILRKFLIKFAVIVMFK